MFKEISINSDKNQLSRHFLSDVITLCPLTPKGITLQIFICEINMTEILCILITTRNFTNSTNYMITETDTLRIVKQTTFQ